MTREAGTGRRRERRGGGKQGEKVEARSSFLAEEALASRQREIAATKIAVSSLATKRDIFHPFSPLLSPLPHSSLSLSLPPTPSLSLHPFLPTHVVLSGEISFNNLPETFANETNYQSRVSRDLSTFSPLFIVLTG